MVLIRFASSQRYGTQVPLRQLAFRVTVSRAFLIEKENPEVLCEVTVPWNGKLPSPQERLAMYQQLEAAVPARAPLADAAADPLAAPPAVLATDGSDAGLLPSVAQITAQLSHPSAQLFTRPPMEDFIDAGEEEFPVEPPQGPSLLAPIVLRQHRRDHKPNNNMYIMWATGALTGLPGAAAPPPPLSPTQGGSAGDGGGGDDARGARPRTEAAAAAIAPAQAVAGLTWVGEERVLCRITAERSENFFTAKPSLYEPHTILVDAVHIYSFVVEPVDVAALGEEQGSGSQEGVGGGRGRRATGLAAAATATLAAAEQATENIRMLSAQATVGFEGLLLSDSSTSDPATAATRERAAGGGALGAHAQARQARRMLRDAAKAVPDVRATSNARASGNVVASATAGTVFVPDRVLLGATPAESGPSTEAAAMGSGRRAAREGRRCRYAVFGVVERCLGLPYDTLYLKCVLQQDTARGAHSTTRDRPPFFFEQEALALHRELAGVGLGMESAAQPHPLVFATQLAYAGAVTVEDYLVEVDHVFNTPFEHTYVDDALPKAPLRLAVAAFTEGIGGDGHQAPVGYASVSLPTLVPGTHKVQCPMWAPHMTGKEYVKAAVVGGGPGLVDVRESGPALRNRTGVAVKQGLLADSKGMLYLTVNVLQQWEAD